MSKLASILFVSVMLCACSSDEERITKLIKNDAHLPAEIVINNLVEYGDQATDQLVGELENADASKLWLYTRVLCEIPSAKRDMAFIEVLSNYMDREEGRLAHWYGSAMVDALAENQCYDAIPVLTKIAQGENEDEEVKSHATAALGALNSPLPARAADEFILINEPLQLILDSEDLKNAGEAMIATIDQVFSNTTTSTFILESVKIQKADLRLWKDEDFAAGKDFLALIHQLNAEKDQYNFEGKYLGHSGSWDIYICIFDFNTVLAYADFTRKTGTGWVWGAGYVGKLIKTNNRWIVVKWDMVYVV